LFAKRVIHTVKLPKMEKRVILTSDCAIFKEDEAQNWKEIEPKECAKESMEEDKGKSEGRGLRYHDMIIDYGERNLERKGVKALELWRDFHKGS